MTTIRTTTTTAAQVGCALAMALTLAVPAAVHAQQLPTSETQTPGNSESGTSGPNAAGGETRDTGETGDTGGATPTTPAQPASGAPAGGDPSRAAGAGDRAGSPSPGPAAPASDIDAAAAAAAAAEKVPAPSIRDQVQGTCRTPREAWLQLLYWLQQGERWEPAKAAMCFDTIGLDDPVAEAPKLAEMLKVTLDGRDARVAVERIPTDPNYVDDSGLPRYFEPNVRAEFSNKVFLVKRGQRWLFSAETLDEIPNMYPQLTGWLQQYLPAWTRTRVLGIEMWKYLAIIVLVVLAAFVRRVAMLIVSRYLRRLLSKTQLKAVGIIERAERPVGGLAMALVFYIGVPMLLFPIHVTRVAMVAIEALAAFSVVWLGYRLIEVLGEYLSRKATKTESKLDDQLVPLVSKTLKVFVSVVGGIFIAQNLDIEIGSLLAGVGIGGLAFALAAKDTIANFFGSLMIFIDKPFQIGDWVVMSGTEGVVEEVGFRTSRVRTFYNSLVTVPNALVTTAIVDNYGAREYRRYVTNLGLTYDTPPDKVEAFCEGVRAIIAAMPGMRKDYYLVEFKEFGDSSLVIMIYCFMISKSWNEELRTRTTLNLEIMRLAQKLGVSFAFPTQTVHVETLAQSGESRPSHSGPSEHTELAKIIDGFGPQGEYGRPGGLALTKGYDCGPGPKRGGDEDGG